MYSVFAVATFVLSGFASSIVTTVSFALWGCCTGISGEDTLNMLHLAKKKNVTAAITYLKENALMLYYIRQ